MQNDIIDAMKPSVLARTMDRAMRLAPLFGRVFISAIFIHAAYGKITGWEETAEYMASREMPLVPFFLVMAIIFEAGGGLMVLSGLFGRLGAAMLILFLIPTTLVFHNWWTYPETQQQMQLIAFLKNTAVIGGLLMMFRLGAGEFSLDSLLARKRQPG